MKAFTYLTAVVLVVIAIGVGISASAWNQKLTLSLAPRSPFCRAATQWVGTYSVNVMWRLGLNDGRALPTHMTSGIESAVTTMAGKTTALAELAPMTTLASPLRALAKQLEQSTVPSEIVRAEAAFGAKSFVNVALACSSAMMIMSSQNPLGDYGKY